MEQKYLPVLEETPLFKGIAGSDLEATLACLSPQTGFFRRNDFIALSGQKMPGLGMLLSGEAAVLKESITGNRVMMTVLEPGDLFGEMAVFSGQDDWPASVLAQKDSTVMFLPPAKILGECHKVCDSHRILITNMLRILSEKALLLNRKVEYLAMKSLRGKISRYLLEQSRAGGNHTFMIPLRRNELADFLGVSRPSLSREMCRMRDEGLIEFHRESIRIMDKEALRGAAE